MVLQLSKRLVIYIIIPSTTLSCAVKSSANAEALQVPGLRGAETFRCPSSRGIAAAGNAPGGLFAYACKCD